jgi:hypothetical protein
MREVMIPHLHATLDVDWTQWATPFAGPGGALRDPHWKEAAIGRLLTSRPQRFRRYVEALTEVRSAAATGTPLTWSWMQQIQRIVLGSTEVAFRSGPAFAWGGSERYAYFTGLPELFARKVEADAADHATPLAQGVRLWLDVLFVHPFADGNARCALLMLEYCLARAGQRLRDYGAMRRLPIRPVSAARYRELAPMVRPLLEGSGGLARSA